MISSTPHSVQTAQRRTRSLSPGSPSRDTDILREFQPVIRRLAEQYIHERAPLHTLVTAFKRQALYLVDAYDPAGHGPFRPYLLRGLTAFVANYTEGCKPALFDSVSQLPSRQRQAFELRYLDRLSIESISTAMGIRPTSVRSLLHGAAERLRRKLATG